MAFCITRLKRAHRYPQLCFFFSVFYCRFLAAAAAAS
jgi:hypothetical protein